MKKRYIALMLLVTIAFTGCTKGGTATVKPAEPATEATATEVASTEVTEATEETVSAAETKEAEGPTEAASEEEAKLVKPVTIEHQIKQYRSKDGTCFASAGRTYFWLNDEMAAKYPKLNDVLKKRRDEDKKFLDGGGMDEMVSMAEDAANDGGVNMLPFYEYTDEDLLRFDDKLFVIGGAYDDFQGGAHGTYYSIYVSIDSQTGEILDSNDFITDRDAAVTAVYESLINDDYYSEILYGEYEHIEKMKDVISDEAESGNLIVTSYGGEYYVYFPTYVLGCYAAGDFFVKLTADEAKGFNEDYLTDMTLSMATLTERRDTSLPDGEVDYTAPEMVEYTPENPSWKHFSVNSTPDELHSTIEFVKKESYKNKFLDDWEIEHGFINQSLPYTDEDLWVFTPMDEVDYFYDFQTLEVANDNTGEVYRFYLNYVMNGPDDENGEYNKGHMNQYVQYAVKRGNVLYVECKYNGYSNSNPNSSYIVAINMDTGKLIWRSDPLVANANNFVITDSSLICGYGFTDEKDYLYELDLQTGETVQKIKLDKAPDEFILVGAKLYVFAYDVAYEFDISEG